MPGFFGNATRRPHFEKWIATCIATTKNTRERIEGKIEVFEWDSRFLGQKFIKK
jgi:hypothetical protein